MTLTQGLTCIEDVSFERVVSLNLGFGLHSLSPLAIQALGMCSKG